SMQYSHRLFARLRTIDLMLASMATTKPFVAVSERGEPWSEGYPPRTRFVHTFRPRPFHRTSACPLEPWRRVRACGCDLLRKIECFAQNSDRLSQITRRIEQQHPHSRLSRPFDIIARIIAHKENARCIAACSLNHFLEKLRRWFSPTDQ